MTSVNPNDSFAFLLPPLKRDSTIRPSNQVGQWQNCPASTFQEIAISLDSPASQNLRSISAIPTPWARALLMEMALHDEDHPLHPHLVEQWQGMLGAIALAKVRQFPLKAQWLDLEKSHQEDLFSRSLYELLPATTHTLYSLGTKNPWQELYLFLWQGQPVGMTTPSTLICPSVEGEWTGVPWWLGNKLRSPHLFLNTKEKALLWRWLENLRQELQKSDGGKPTAINRIAKLITDFQGNLGEFPTQPLRLTETGQFFDLPTETRALTLLDFPIKAEPQPSNVRLIASLEKAEKKKPLLIITPDLAKAWGVYPQDIWIHETTTLATLDLRAFKEGKIHWKDVDCIAAEELLLPELFFITAENAILENLFPQLTQPLTFQDRPITPLLPLNPILLDYLTPEDLINCTKIQLINQSKNTFVRITLELSLSGIQSETFLSKFSIYKDYALRSENALNQIPVLEIFPNFRTLSWQKYYAFYADNQLANNTFLASFPEAKKNHRFQEDTRIIKIAQFDKFPTFIQCYDSTDKLLGLILLEPPPVLNSQAIWQVGVDFGTSFTNVYIHQNGLVEQLKLESLNLKITESDRTIRSEVLREFFIPDNLDIFKLPLASILTTRGNLSILKGRIYIPDANNFKPQAAWIKTNLKWLVENIDSRRLFLEFLTFYINAVAAKNQVSEIEWLISYPSSLSLADKNRYTDLWKELTTNLTKETGIIQTLANLKTESLAFAQYFGDFELRDLIRTSCIDLGSGTADISIWENNKLVHQCSVLFGGRDIFSQFLEFNPSLLKKIFKLNSEEWKGLQGGAFTAKLDIWLLNNSEQWLRENKSTEPDFIRLQNMITIGIAGLYYYIGIILRTLRQENKYSRREITPVYLGGKGSRFLNWLVNEEQFNKSSQINNLFSSMLSAGSEFVDLKETTRLSLNPKGEVACGLVLNESKLQGIEESDPEPYIAGENYQWDGRQKGWKTRLPSDFLTDSLMEGFDLKQEQMYQIPKFLYSFSNYLSNLGLGYISLPLDYRPSPKIQDNQIFWRQIHREITADLLKLRGNSENFYLEPPFILGLKALLRVLGKEWRS